MKKLILLIGVFSIFTLSSCSEDTVNTNETKNELSYLKKTIEDPIIIYGPPGERGEAGPGYWGPFTIPFNTCNQPNGECKYHKGFGGGSNPKWIVKDVNVDILRLSFINENIINHDQLVESLSLESSLQGFDLDLMANFIKIHYNIPNKKTMDYVLNQKILSVLGMDSNHQIYVKPNEYEIFIDDENPFGYIDIEIEIE